MLKTGIMGIIGLVFMILSYVLGMVKPIIKKKVEKTESKVDDVIFNAVVIGVDTVDRLLNGKSAESKKQRAMDLATMTLEKLGISVEKEVLGDLVERAVTINAVNKAERENEKLVPTGE